MSISLRIADLIAQDGALCDLDIGPIVRHISFLTKLWQQQPQMQ